MILTDAASVMLQAQRAGPQGQSGRGERSVRGEQGEVGVVGQKERETPVNEEELQFRSF
jgi:hypothetical protein